MVREKVLVISRDNRLLLIVYTVPRRRFESVSCVGSQGTILPNRITWRCDKQVSPKIIRWE